MEKVKYGTGQGQALSLPNGTGQGQALSLPIALLCLLLGLVASLFIGCDIAPGLATSATPTPSTNNNAPGNLGTPQLNTWYQGGPGVTIRYEDWKSPGDNEDTVTIARFDLQDVRLSVEYQPTQPLLLSNWMQKEHAIAIINGGYFDAQDNATALVIAHGQTSGESYQGFGGMLSVDSQGNVNVRSLSQQPYNPGEQLQQATQCSPMLITPGGHRTQFDANAASSRRSVVAIDKQGRLLFIVSPNNAFSLDELDDLLMSSDLSIDRALNLDGGASTGLYVNSGSLHVAVDSVAQLPLVIVVKGK